jgi:hypothetical protein
VIQNEQLRRDMNFVVDSFSGMDGSIHYMKLCKHINKLEKSAKTDRQALDELTIIQEFARIVVNVK